MESEIAKVLTEIIERPKNADQEERHRELSKSERLMHLFLKIVKYLVVLGIVSLFSSSLNYYGQAVGKSSKEKDNRPQVVLISRPNDPLFYSTDIYIPQSRPVALPPATIDLRDGFDNPVTSYAAPIPNGTNLVNRSPFDLSPPQTSTTQEQVEFKLYNMPPNVRRALQFIRIG